MNQNEMVITAPRFLDLLSCVVPAASNDALRENICSIKLEIIAKEYVMRAISTNGHIMSIAQRNLGFEQENQQDMADVIIKEKLTDKSWVISKLDAELLIVALKKLGVKRNSEKENPKVFYISLAENSDNNKLRISILGMSQVILDPDLIREEYPDWKRVIPAKTGNVECISFDLANLALVHKCWGKEKIYITFVDLSGAVKINRNVDARSEENQEKENDLIMIMPTRSSIEELDRVRTNQMELFK